MSVYDNLVELEKCESITENQKLLKDILEITFSIERPSSLTEKQKKERRRLNRQARLARKRNR